ncbi:hypothetical protein D3C79_1111770 [compost metagenome]
MMTLRSSALSRVRVTRFICSSFLSNGVNVPESRYSMAPSSLTVTPSRSHNASSVMYCV